MIHPTTLVRLAASALAVGRFTVAPTVAEAGSSTPTTGSLLSRVQVLGDDRGTTISDIKPTLEIVGVGDVHDAFCNGSEIVTSVPGAGKRLSECSSLPFDSYRVGVQAIPSGFELVSSKCRELDAGVPVGDFESFAQVSADRPEWECVAVLAQHHRLFVDVVVDGGPLSASDFAVEVFDEAGAPVASSVDGVDDVCTQPEIDATNCAAIRLEPASYRLDQQAVEDYEVESVECRFIDGTLEVFPGTTRAFVHDSLSDTHCVVRSRFVAPPTTTTTPAPPTSTAPTATTVPSATAPAGPPTTAAEPDTLIELPATGRNGSLVLLAGALVLVGGLAVAAARRQTARP